jgi:ABC-type glycerol-3-phosphate transport system permease component
MLQGIKSLKFFENRTGRKRINRSIFGTVLLALLLALFGLFMALPMVYVISNAFKPLEEIFLFPPRLFVQHPTLDNFKGMGDLISNMWISFERYLFNSAFVSVAGTGLYLLVATLAAYPLAKHDFPGRKWLNELITVALMFTASVTGLVQYLLMAMVGMIDTYSAMILPSLSSTMGVFLCVQNLHSISNTMLEAGRIDGAGEFKIFYSLVLPNIRPVLFTMLIFQFQGMWNMSPGNVVYSEPLKTLPLAISQIASAGISRAGVGSAAALVMIIPPIFVFVISQSNVMETMSSAGMKG